MARKASSSTSIGASTRVLVLHGSEQYLLRRHVQTLVEALTEAHGELARFALDGETTTAADVLDELRSFGLMAEHKLVIVEQADRFLARGDHRRLVEGYCEKPMEQATLVLRASRWNAGNLDKLIAKVGVIMACDPPTATAAVDWVQRRLMKETGQRIEPEAAAMLVERVGPDLARLDCEVMKVACFAGEGEVVTVAHVAEMTSRSREEIVWQIQGPLMAGDVPTALAILAELYSGDPRREVLYIFAVVDALRKLHDGAALIDEGVRGFELFKAAKLWGPDRDRLADAMASAATRPGREGLASLFHAAVRTEQRTRNGEASHGRVALEALLVRVGEALGVRPTERGGRRPSLADPERGSRQSRPPRASRATGDEPLRPREGRSS
jgi:DNA polymerase III delta subunit